MKTARFRQAVPIRSDRRDLRRGLRAVARAVRAEQKQELSAVFARLATHRVPLARVRVRPGRESDQTLEFADGTSLDVAVLDSTVSLGHLKEWAVRQLTYLGSAHPCVWPGLYSLHFLTFTQQQLAVLARVGHVEPAKPGARDHDGWHVP